MSYDFSNFGRQFGLGSGIGALMEDLGAALASGGPELRMLGGGQPARIPEMERIWSERLGGLLGSGAVGMARMASCYDPPQGNASFLADFAGLLRREYGWDIGPEHVAVTSGGQMAFFLLLNLLCGPMPDGCRRKVLLPLVPEYIGYAGLGIDGPLFDAVEPRIEELGGNEFKYRVDFDVLRIGKEIGAVCASRPTNPTGNVLTDGEVRHLSALAREAGVPLILDNAYGFPFPGMLFNRIEPFWEPHVILTFSLSKIGLPGCRTGIVVGPPEVIRALGSMNAMIGLANPNLGQALVQPLIASGEILRLSREVVQPYYSSRCESAQAAVREAFGGRFAWRMHRAEGAVFLWLWFPGLPISSQMLYERLKRRQVLVVPGEHFFFGAPGTKHSRECLRISYAMEPETVRAGLEIIAEEVEAAHQGC